MTLKLKKKNLIFFTGLIWLGAAFVLLHRSYTWIDLLTDKQLFFSVLIALFIAVIKIYLIFHKLTVKNIDRIVDLKDVYVSIFKFHAVKDQVLIVVMILVGILLRHLPTVPKSVLMPIYIGIGLAMFYSFLIYMRYFYGYYKTLK